MEPPRFKSPLLLIAEVQLWSMWRRLVSVREQSWLFSGGVAVFLIGYLFLAWALFFYGLRFLGQFPGLGSLLAERLIFLLFTFLFGLLALSNIIVAYTNLFRHRETAFLLALPVPMRTIFAWKMTESILLASWAFLFLVTPLLLAYGMNRRVGFEFYPATVLLLAGYILLPGIAGASLAIALARWLDRRVFQWLLGLGLIFVIGSMLWWMRPAVDVETLSETRTLSVIDRLLERTRFAQFPFQPGFWVASSVQNAAEGSWDAAGFFALVMLSYVLWFGWMVWFKLGDAFYDGASAVQSRGGESRKGWWWRTTLPNPGISMPGLTRFQGWRSDPWDRVLAWLAPDVRALVLKEGRMFWRDTTQWGQSLVLFGLLVVYLSNIRHFSQQLDNPFWSNLVGYLNLVACSLNMATVSTRFVFPQFSLEGRRIWLVGLAPLGLVRVLRTKFWLASIVGGLITVVLILLSARSLRMETDRTLYFVLVIFAKTICLNAMAVGLGALYPNFRETQPSKIVSGFGGTLCLILSFGYIVASVALLAVVSPWDWRSGELNEWKLAWSLVGFIVISSGISFAILRWGEKAIARLEL